MAWADRHKQATGAALKGHKAAFHFTAHPWDLVVLPSGEVLPVLGIVTHEKGLDGCRSTGPGASDVDEAGALLNATRASRTIIEPDAIEVLAWGKVRKGYLGNENMEPIKAQGGDYWLDAWTRLTWNHNEPHFSVDAEGYLDFHRRVLAIVCPNGLTTAQIEKAEARSGIKAGPGGAPFPVEETEPEPEPKPAPKTRKGKGA
jgi:hypothetical protein